MTDKTDRKVKSLIAKFTAGGEHKGGKTAEALGLKGSIQGSIYATVDLGIIGDPRAVPVLVQASKNKICTLVCRFGPLLPSETSETRRLSQP